MKEQSLEGGGRVLLSDNTDDGTVIQRAIKFQCVFGFKLSSLMYAYI
jgi:hypothetical protein